MKSLAICKAITEAYFISKIWAMEEIISGIEDMIEEMDRLVKENNKPEKTHNTKHPGNLAHYENNKYKNNRIRGRKRNPGQWFKNFSTKS